MHWLYPELRQFDPRKRDEALHKAKEYPFDAIELVGLAFSLTFVVILTKYSVGEMGIFARLSAVLANFIIAVPLLCVFAGPFYLTLPLFHESLNRAC